ncbi:MAG: hypothetical protein RLZZ65_1665 [Bacteroidota bacterium]|jgi:hypothetical protein
MLAQNLKLSNAIIIAQFEKEEDRYAMQATLSELFKAKQIKVLPVMNVIKQGEDIQHLLSDSIQALISQKGFDTYMVVNVRGYDRKFKESTDTPTLAEMLETTSIYHIYRDEATSVTFEFSFYRAGKLVARDVLRCGNISDRDSVLKRMRKRLPKKLMANWLAA